MLVTTKEQIIRNLDKIEYYLTGANEEHYNEMAGYIARGRVLLAYFVDGSCHFAPSRFIGYKDNNLSKHVSNSKKHGTVTTLAISKIVGRNHSDDALESSFLEYCKWLGKSAAKNSRTYWLLDDDVSEILTSGHFSEGAYVLRTHVVRERNHKVVQEAKKLFMKSHGNELFCEVCGFNFAKTYGKHGKDFIEAHHRVGLSKTCGEHSVRPEDFVMVCSNCHSMLHRGEMTVEKLKRLLK